MQKTRLDPNYYLSRNLKVLAPSICAFSGSAKGQLGHRMHSTRPHPYAILGVATTLDMLAIAEINEDPG